MRLKFTLLFVLACILGQSVYADSFLTTKDMPKGENYLMAPPTYSDFRFMDDWLQYNWGKSIRNTPRGQQATVDASTSTSNFCTIFSPAMGITLSSSKTPEIYTLLNKGRTDGNSATTTVKNYYMKERPFMKFNESTLLPSSEESLRSNGSFPSGHTAQGWTIALLLSEINPERQDTILSRGYQYGQSRVIGGFHWQSDIDGGRCAAAAAVARLHDDPGFLAQMQKAKNEFKKLTGKDFTSSTQLKTEDFARGEKFLPAPPDTASQRFVSDWLMYNWGKKFRSGTRSAEASNDQLTSAVNLCKVFTPAFGTTLSSSKSRNIYNLINRVREVVGNATESTKTAYPRKRPFAQFCEVSHLPGYESAAIKSSSYPSEHAAIGWAVALVLTELNHERADTILSRGYQMGLSRIISGYHYLTDVEAGRTIGSTTLARLHTDLTFLDLLEKARAEYKTITGISSKPYYPTQSSGAYYNLQGVEINKPQNGEIYIQDGKKYKAGY